MSINTLCKKLSNTDITVNNKIIDIFYEYKSKNNKIIKRKEEVIILTIELMEHKLKDKNINNFFIDVTYKIIPKNNENHYKLLTITGTDNTSNNSYICALILLTYEDSISFEKIFKYMHEMYGFNPPIVHIDYSVALTKSLDMDNIFDSKPIIVHCYFILYKQYTKKWKT